MGVGFSNTRLWTGLSCLCFYILWPFSGENEASVNTCHLHASHQVLSSELSAGATEGSRSSLVSSVNSFTLCAFQLLMVSLKKPRFLHFVQMVLLSKVASVVAVVIVAKNIDCFCISWANCPLCYTPSKAPSVTKCAPTTYTTTRITNKKWIRERELWMPSWSTENTFVQYVTLVEYVFGHR